MSEEAHLHKLTAMDRKRIIDALKSAKSKNPPGDIFAWRVNELAHEKAYEGLTEAIAIIDRQLSALHDDSQSMFMALPWPKPEAKKIMVPDSDCRLGLGESREVQALKEVHGAEGSALEWARLGAVGSTYDASPGRGRTYDALRMYKLDNHPLDEVFEVQLYGKRIKVDFTRRNYAILTKLS